eukprot:gene341-974_t
MYKILVSILLVSSIASTLGEVSLSGDPSLFPGHLKPIGTGRPQGNVAVVDEYPQPDDFFKNYVAKSVPLLIRGAATKSPAFKLWQDDYLKSHKEAETFQVFVENRKKEIRTEGGHEISLKQFIETYHTTDMYMVNGVPDHLQKDVRIPAPLRCESTRKMLVDTVTWFSSGGTKSVLHNDDVDNINCLFRGSKQLMFINYDKYKSKVVLDRPEGGYSAMDVDAVDFVKYPGMREVEYINATMSEGDCVFIPYKWYHQVNSWSNDDGMNVAVNVWFEHSLNHHPKNCKLNPEEATLDKYVFSDLERQKREKEEAKSSDGEEPSKDQGQLDAFENYLKDTGSNEMMLEQFAEKIKNEKSVTNADISSQPVLKSFKGVVKVLFDFLDANKNGKLDTGDFDMHEKNFSETSESELRRNIALIEDYAEDLVEALNKGVSAQDFDAGFVAGGPNVVSEEDSESDSNDAMKDEL